MLFRDKAGLVQQGQFVSRLPDVRRDGAMTAHVDPLERATGTDLRVVTWNVANRNWNQNPEPYRRILRALQPDVVLLVEVLDRTTETWIRSFIDSLGAQSGAWQFLLGKTGGWDRCLVASRLPLTGAFDEVRHTSETIQRLGPIMDKPVANSAAPHKTMEDGITSTAAYIAIGGRSVLTTAVHLACCDNLARSPAEQRREAEASAIAEKLREAMQSHPVQAVLTAGDLNLVSTRRAMDLLREHLDVTGGDLSGEAALRLNGWATSTYVPTPRTPFPASKLDYLFYSPSSLELRRAFVFDSGELAPEWLTHYGISVTDSTASDHLAVIADLGWRK
jgi:endonuclease/exonuclease/phosphatase family metal-dependent hydrolase